MTGCVAMRGVSVSHTEMFLSVWYHARGGGIVYKQSAYNVFGVVVKFNGNGESHRSCILYIRL